MTALESGTWRLDDVRAHLLDSALDDGLLVELVWEERHADRRILFAKYRDARADEGELGFWWDVDAEPGWTFTDAVEVATYLRIWLEEAFHAGPSIEDRPRDGDGLSWVCPGLPAAAMPPGR